MGKYGRILFCTLLLSTMISGVQAAELPKQVVPLGRAVGIKLFSDGVVVVGMSPVETIEGQLQPAKEAGLKVGDIVTKINGTEVDTIENVQEILEEAQDNPLALAVVRSGKELQITAVAVETPEGEHKLGLWLRDSMAGIGTLTFYDPDTQVYGALGHGVNDVDTAQLMPLESGAILFAEVADVRKGLSGSPGELQGSFDVTRELGDLQINSEIGIYGKLEDLNMWTGMAPIDVAEMEEITVGEAKILANISVGMVEEFSVNIVQVYPLTLGETRNMMIEVTDPRLLDVTGGIIQGMSGSPILQNDKIIGAVTHVLVNDPTRGYGTYIGNMLEASEGV
ncbi:MAG: SpoIVB peptidase [Eubacteriales bacterium]